MGQDKTKIYFIRHVQATGNVQKRFQGLTDNDITEHGEIQRQNLREFFQNISLDAIYTSPLIRARKTAEAVFEITEAPLRIEEQIKEIFVGPWENMPLEKIKESWPKEFENWGTAPWKFQLEGAESMREVYTRCANFIEKLKEKERGKNVAVVSHGGVMKSLITASLNKPIAGLMEIGWISNGSVSLVEIDKSGVATLEYVNKYDHICPETVLIPGYAGIKKESEK